MEIHFRHFERKKSLLGILSFIDNTVGMICLNSLLGIYNNTGSTSLLCSVMNENILKIGPHAQHSRNFNVEKILPYFLKAFRTFSTCRPTLHSRCALTTLWISFHDEMLPKKNWIIQNFRRISYASNALQRTIRNIHMLCSVYGVR